MNRQGTNVLLLSAGRRVALLQAFQRELAARFPSSAVYATDLNPALSAACQVADKAFALPRVTAAGYVDRLLELCVAQRVGLVVPTIDTELLDLARARDRFAREGVQVVVSDEPLTRRCRDKRQAAALFEELRMAAPLVMAPDALCFPCFAKPYDGSRSVRAVKLATAADLTEAMRADPELMFTEYVDGSHDEYTVDAYFGRAGNLCCLVPRHRVEVRDGESSKGVTRRNHVYDYLLQRLGRIEGARGCLTLQLFAHPGRTHYVGVEINPRFGGGYPLSYAAGANYPGWLIDEYLLERDIPFFDGWEADLLMLRYDAQVLAHGAA